MNMDRKQMSEAEKRVKSEADFLKFVEECLDEGWSPTRCPEGCAARSRWDLST